MEKSQPLHTLMNKLGLSNADLVKVSTEQLSFKMVQKGRNGRRLTPNVQGKILNALLAARPELKLSRRDLFRYEMEEETLEGIKVALSDIGAKKINYPQFIDRLLEVGVVRYMTEVPENRVTFFGIGGAAHIEQGPQISQSSAGNFDEAGIRSAIAAAQKTVIDHPTFLKRIHEAGISTYEVNLRERKIVYKGKNENYRENIPVYTTESEIKAPTPATKSTQAKSKKPKKITNRKYKHLTTKARASLRKRLAKRRKSNRRR